MCSALWIVVCPLSFFCWPLCCLSFDLRILINPLVSSNSSDNETQSTLVLRLEGQMTLRRVPLMEQGLLTIPDHLRSTPSYLEYELKCSIFKRTTYAYTVLCPFSGGHCVVCPSIYGFWLTLWCLQTLLTKQIQVYRHMWFFWKCYIWVRTLNTTGLNG
jgi:hypothetical protein